jgi:hypothetical protein
LGEKDGWIADRVGQAEAWNIRRNNPKFGRTQGSDGVFKQSACARQIMQHHDCRTLAKSSHMQIAADAWPIGPLNTRHLAPGSYVFIEAQVIHCVLPNAAWRSVRLIKHALQG